MSSQYFGSVSRTTQVVAGVVLAIAGLFCLAVVAGTVWLSLRPHPDYTNNVIVGTLFLIFGAPATLYAIRLILGRARAADGGLMGPTSLRVAGAAFIVFPLLSLAQGRWDWVLGLVHVGFCAACFTLARFRERLRFASPTSPSTPQ